MRAAVSRTSLTVPASKMRGRVLDVLADEGYIRGYARVEKDGSKPEFEIELKYFEGAPVITNIKRVSKPGLRVYAKSTEIPHVLGGLGVAILSTSSGLLTDREATQKGVGGEVLAYVW